MPRRRWIFTAPLERFTASLHFDQALARYDIRVSLAHARMLQHRGLLSADDEQAIRAEDVALAAKHAFAVAQAFHSYYQKPKYSVLHAETEDLRAGRTLVVDAFVRQVEVLLGLLGIPVPERM